MTSDLPYVVRLSDADARVDTSEEEITAASDDEAKNLAELRLLMSSVYSTAEILRGERLIARVRSAAL